MIHPSPALIVRADTPIADCVHLMRDQKVGSVLVVSDDFNATLLGIFTERDLLHRIHQIEGGSFWKKPIHAVMTRPVVTIRIERLAEAPHLMLKHGFRHLPVLARTSEGGPYLAGVVSMRDFFRAWCIEREGKYSLALGLLEPLESESESPKDARPEIRVFSHDSTFLKLLTLQAWKPALVNSVPALEKELLATAGSRGSAPLVIDADLLTAAHLARLLKIALALKTKPRILIAYDPLRHPSRVQKLFQSLSSVRGISVFKRPINLIALSTALEEMRQAAR